MGMIGKVVEIKRWNKTEGQVFKSIKILTDPSHITMR